MRLTKLCWITTRQTVGTVMCSGTPRQDYNPNLLVFIGHLVDTKVLTNYPRAVFFIFIDTGQNVTSKVGVLLKKAPMNLSIVKRFEWYPFVYAMEM